MGSEYSPTVDAAQQFMIQLIVQGLEMYRDDQLVTLTPEQEQLLIELCQQAQKRFAAKIEKRSNNGASPR